MWSSPYRRSVTYSSLCRQFSPCLESFLGVCVLGVEGHGVGGEREREGGHGRRYSLEETRTIESVYVPGLY